MKIHQEITFKATPQQLYKILTEAKKFAECTHTKAEISPLAGGPFSCFDGMITGQTIEALAGERLVQAWRVANWEPGEYSIVRFEFIPKGDTETTIVFDHTGFPEEHIDHLEQGWPNKYWEPIKAYLETP